VEERAAAGVFEVPVQAVGTADGAPVLWRLDAETSTVSPVTVELAGPAGQSMRVRSEALKPGDEIVISGVRFLSDGMKVGRMAGAGGE
jgi:multidrug efflux pump subunit AcrA (membrane-fusion protein)